MSNEPSPRPWRVVDKPNGQLILYNSIVENSDGLRVAFVCRSADAALIVNAANIYDHQFDRYIEALRAERDRLRDELTRKVKNYEDVIACHKRTEESLRDIVRRLLMLRRGDIAVPMDMEKRILAEARAAIGEDKE